MSATDPVAGAGAGYIQPRAAWRVTLDGQDLTDRMRPRLIALELSERRGEEADTLTIHLHDADGALAIPPARATLTVALGWDRGTGVTQGLVDKGRFLVDEVAYEGPPSRLTITARAADLAGPIAQRRDRMWSKTTIGAIVARIAGDHGLTPACHPDLAARAVAADEQARQSDLAFLAALGRRHDAVATVKAGRLILAPVGAATTPGGAARAQTAIARADGDRFAWRRSKREEADGAEAQYHDRAKARRETERKGDGTRKRSLGRVHASKADADAAADGARRRAAREAEEVTLTRAHGDAALGIDDRLRLTGFKPTIDARTWLVAAVTHKIDAQGGFVSDLTLDLGESG